ncbi:MAG: oxaloacetate decarboxylase [Alphaproteobacteria bacterium]|nr:oxaloacetate decarboxylase [Alphaproteobacteria bacterium]
MAPTKNGYIPLKRQLQGPGIVVAPGCFDAFSAMMVARAGFSVAYVTGASIAYTRLGMPDIGLVSMNEVAQTVSLISERVEIPLIVDGDTGYGNALNVRRTVRLFETSGAAAIQLEDQTFPKRCGHLKGKTVVPTGEMVGKIKAAVDARRSSDFLIVARTDAIAVNGFADAIDRAERFVEAGADVLFIEAPETEQQQRDMCQRFKGRAPLLANMVEGGATPLKTAGELQDLGYGLVIFPGGLFRAYSHMAGEYLATLKRDGTTNAFRNRMFDFKQINELLGTDDVLAMGATYDAKNFQ